MRATVVLLLATGAGAVFTTTGTITATPTNITVSNSASRDPTTAVNVPASAVADLYTGTLTQSVS